MILESSYRRLFAFIPREVLASKQLACDPLPPPTTVNEYNVPEFFQRGADDVFAIRPRTRRDTQRLLGGELSSGTPWFVGNCRWVDCRHRV